jgi:hypothetical protein
VRILPGEKWAILEVQGVDRGASDALEMNGVTVITLPAGWFAQRSTSPLRAVAGPACEVDG